MIRILARIRSEPWAITQEWLAAIVEIAERRGEKPEAVAARLGRPLDNAYDVEERDGIAILPISGPLFRYANLFTDLSGATSYDLLARDFARAIADPRIDAIVLNVDSPGGEATGVSEFADQIYAARGKKPIVAYVDGTAASAAYWLASAADEVVVNDTALVGSIGVVLATLDTSERDAKAGVRRVEIVSSQSPYKRLDPETDTGRARLQARVDALSEVFVEKVARNRGVAVQTVLRDFGQGDVMVGEAAVRAGLADRVSNFEAVLADLQARVLGEAAAIVASGDTEEGAQMSAESANAPTEAAPAQAATAPATAQPEAGEAARTAAHAAGVADGRASERARIKAILTADEASERAELAAHLAFETDMTVETATAALAKAPKQSAKGEGFARFDAAMRDAGNPRVGADTGADDTVETAVERSVALGKQFGIR